MQERTASQAAVGQSACTKITTYADETLGAKGGSIRSDRSSICNRGCRASCRGCLWNFGTFSPCGVLREAIRQRGDLVVIFPDGVIDFAFEAQFGEMSAKRCFAVLLEAVTSPVQITGQTSQLSMQPFAPRQGEQRSSPSVPRSAPFALRAQPPPIPW
jgi:hypothetical protein